MLQGFHQFFSNLWYTKNTLHYLFVPFSLIFCVIVSLKRKLYVEKILKSTSPPIPVIVVGNISVGGTGKTPLIIELAHRLKNEGYSVGILCRGYKGKSKQWPVLVTSESDPVMTGDESVLLARRTNSPVVAGPDRVKNADMLFELSCDLILSDDGLQHYSLARDIEILTLSYRQGLYNRFCLPAGPFRESQRRLAAVDFTVSADTLRATDKNWPMSKTIEHIYKLSNERVMITLGELQKTPIHAIAAIGYPEQYFQMLEHCGLTVIRHAYPDHFHLSEGDFEFNDVFPIVMTEKDAVKYKHELNDRCWVARLKVDIDTQFFDEVLMAIKAIYTGDNVG